MDIKKLEAIVKIEPENPRHWFNLAIAYINENRIGDAHKSLEESIKLNPYFAPAQFFAGLLLLYGRDFKNGIKYLEKATTIDENVYNKLIADHLLREILSNLVKMSVKVIQDQLEFQPNNIENLSALGKILLYTKNFEAAINYFRKIIELKPDNWDAYLHLGLAYEGLDNYEQAIFYLKRAVAVNQFLAEAYWIMGRIYLKIGNYGLAMKNYEKAVEIAPNNTRYLNSLAKLYFTLDKNAQAIRTLQLAIDNNPNSKWSYYYLGQCLEKEYQFDIAIEQYEKAINIDPQFVEAKLALAKLYQLNNNTKRAIEILEELAFDSNDPEILLFLAQLYYSTNNFTKAKEVSQKILKMKPDDKNALYIFTISSLKLYQSKEEYVDEEDLIKNLETFYQLNPNDPIISTELFKIFVDRKDFYKAKEVLEKSKISIKDQDTAKRIAFIYLQEKKYEKFLFTLKNYNLYSFDYLLDIVSLLKEQDSDFLSTFFNEIIKTVDSSHKDFIKMLVIYLEYIYFTNTLQALEFYKNKVDENLKAKLWIFEILLSFTLFSEYKDKKYLDTFIELVEKYIPSYENVGSLKFELFSEKIINTIKLVIFYYFVVLKANYDIISIVTDFLLSNKKVSDFEKNVLNTVLSDLLPIFVDNSFYLSVIDIIDSFELDTINVFKKLKVESYLLSGKYNEVLKEAQEYIDRFSYDSYVDILRAIAYFEIRGELPDEIIGNLENAVGESNPLAFALYSLHLDSFDKNEAKRYANRALEFLYTGKHSFKYSYQISITLTILSRFYESNYQLSTFIKGLKQLVSKYPENYVFNYLLGKYLYLVEEYIDSELVIKKALKLAKNSSQLLESQNLLAKIREDREKYQSLINELEKIAPSVSEKIAYINTLYKKDNLDEIYRMLSELENDYSILSMILKFYIFDKLEIKEQVIYYLNLLKTFAVNNSNDTLINLVEHKLLFYSNLEEFEEIKNKAEMDYIKIFKTSTVKENEKVEEAKIEEVKSEVMDEVNLNEINLNEVNLDEVNLNEVGLNQNELDQINVISLSSLDDFEKLDNVGINSSEDFILAYLLKLYFIIFSNDKDKYEKINNIINESNLNLDEKEKLLVSYFEKIENNILKNDLKGLMNIVKELVKNYSKDEYFSFYVWLILAVLSYKQKKFEEFNKWLLLCQQKVENYKFLQSIIKLISSLKTDNEEMVSIAQVIDFNKLENITIGNEEEYVLALFVKLMFLTLYDSKKVSYLNIINEIIGKTKIPLYNGDEKIVALIDNLSKILSYLENDDIKSALIEVKKFITSYSKDKYFSFYASFIMMFVSFKLGKIEDFKKYFEIVYNKKESYPLFKNLIEFVGKVGIENENISN